MAVLSYRRKDFVFVFTPSTRQRWNFGLQSAYTNMPSRDSRPLLWRGAVQCAFFFFLTLVVFQATEPSATVLGYIDTPKSHQLPDAHLLQGRLADGSLRLPTTVAAQFQSQQSAPPSGTLQGRIGSASAAGTNPTVLQSAEQEKQTSTEDVETVCFSRNLYGILDPKTGVFIDQGRTAEEVLAEMKAKSSGAEREAAMDAFASMVEDGEFNSSLIAKLFPTSALVFLVIAALIFLLLLFFMGPLICCRCCRLCCCCVRRRAHSKTGRIPCYLMFGLTLAAFAVAMAIAAYRVDRKALDEATAVVCAGGRSVDAVLYGTRTEMEGTVEGRGVSFAGIKNLLAGSRKLADAADGSNPNNFVDQVKEEILEAVNLDREKNYFKNAKAATSGNLKVAHDITDKASHTNIFVIENSVSLTQALDLIERQLGAINITQPMLDIFRDISLPPIDLSGFDAADEVMDMLSNTVDHVGSASLSAEQVVDTLDFALFFVSAISGALAIMTVLFLIWQLLRPNKCARRTLGVLAILMAILSVIVCITVAVVSLLHKIAIPVCDYAAVRFMDVNSDHPLAKMYGKDSAVFQAFSVCFSETGSGDFLEAEDGTSRIDGALEAIDDATKSICDQIPSPPSVDFLDMQDFDNDARLQSWAVVLKDPLSFQTFPKVQYSGIQQVDSHVPVRQRTMTVYGMKTVKELVQPWKVVISDVASPGDLMVTSKAPSQESLDQWFQQCLQNKVTNCLEIKNAVLALKMKIALMVSKATCYRSDSGSEGRPCSVTELMGGSGGSPVPQNALDRSVSDVVDAVKQLKAKVEGSRDVACNLAQNKISYIKDQVLKLKEGSNCKFARDRVIRLTSHLCYGAIDGLGTGFSLYFLLAIAMLLFSLLLLILIIEDRDNDRYRDTQYTAAAGDAAEPADGAPDAVVVASPEEGKGVENSSSLPSPDGNGGIQGKAPEIPQEDASVDGVDIKPSSHSDGGLRVAASHGIAPRMASIP